MTPSTLSTTWALYPTDGLAQPALGDRAGVGIVQTDHPARRLGHHPTQPATGLRDHALGAPHHGVQVVDRPVQAAFALPDRSAQRTFSVTDHRGGFAHRRFGDPGQFPGDAAHRGLGLITLLLTAQPQLRRDRPGPPPLARAPPVPRPTAGRAAGL